MTYALVQLAMALMDDVARKHWGYDLSRQSGVRSGVMYPLLTRMLDEGWLTDGWEDADPSKKKRPKRRYYEITDLGRIELGAVLQAARSDQRFQNSHSMLPRGAAPAGGFA